jgi:Methyltransferase domain
VARKMLMPTTKPRLDIVQRLLRDRPAFHLGGDARWDSLPETLQAIQRSARPGDSTIETGVGASTVVFAACGAYHTAISPDPHEHERVREYCEQIGIDVSRLSFLAGFSQDVLPSLLTSERTLDVAFIDGAHSFPFPEVDWCYMTRSLKVNGKLLLDDVTIPSVGTTYRHMVLEPNWRLERVLDDRAAAFTLVAAPPPEDWVNQRVNTRYPDFSFASTPKRARLTASYLASEVAHGVARRSPTLRHLYKRLSAHSNGSQG